MTRKMLMIAAGAAVALAAGFAMTAPARAQTGAVAQSFVAHNGQEVAHFAPTFY